MESDRIEREIVIDAPIERVWEVLTGPEHVGRWFGQGEPVPVDLRPGGIMRLDHGQYGDFPVLIVRVEPPRRFSYRWASAFPGEVATEDNSTLVEFTLAPDDGGGTRLRLVESGFARLAIPEEKITTAGYDSHCEGWTGILEIFRKYAEQRTA
jgi:uncharacterized protein YndB with AHSA1/START domain